MPFSPDTMLVVGAIACLVVVPRLYGAVKGKIALPTLPYTRGPAAAVVGIPIDPNDSVEQEGFTKIQGAIHALRRSPRVTKEDLEGLATLAGKLIDLVEPAAPGAPTEVKP